MFPVWAMSAVLAFQVASGQSADPLVDLLLKKGVISKEDFKGDALTRDALLDVLVRKGILTDEEGVRLKSREQKGYATKAEVAAVKQEVQGIVRQDAGGLGLPKWMDGLTIGGDLRVRYESIDQEHAPDTSRGRYRARLGISKKFGDGVEAGIRLATGPGRTSANQTMDTSFSNAELNLDRAYISVNPEIAEWLTLTGGRIANPFVHTNMVWDADLNFDGAAEKVSFAVSEDVSLFATAGQFSLETPAGGDEADYVKLHLDAIVKF